MKRLEAGIKLVELLIAGKHPSKHSDQLWSIAMNLLSDDVITSTTVGEIAQLKVNLK